MRPALVLVPALLVLAASCADAGETPEAPAPSGASAADFDASCASLIEYDGARYAGHGELRRDPALTGRTDEGTVASCDDGEGDTGVESAVVEELVDLPLSRAFLSGGTVFLRQDRPFPEEIRDWFRPPGCEHEGDLALTGTWVGVRTTRAVRFDGDLRPPYVVEMHVDDGDDAYLGATLDVRATDLTDPALGPDDVRSSLWEGGDVRAVVRCEDGRFLATSLTSTPG